ncbi:probable G-protein coupled receptor AH9.1 [Penaeus monodon]|uniref:probable G-protein coupled receptor AH9.1 n=1 Tax=Penaeus monodon TaxID=6687 RepID=UPI0018A7C823|nr:probable G-protein coupled receptor AH9.1 [Penaeus monodon]
MTNISSDGGAAEGSSSGAAASVLAPSASVGVMEIVGVRAEGVVDDVVEETMSPEIQYMGHIAYNVVAPVIISFGILTNVLNLLVLTRPSLRGPTFRYLKWLAVANLLVCVVLLPFTLHSHATPVPYAAALYFAHIEVPVGNALIASSVYIVVGLSIDRFVAVCYPRKYRNLHSHYVASVRIALSFIIAFIMYIPMAFYKVVVPVGGGGGGGGRGGGGGGGGAVGGGEGQPLKYVIEENTKVVSTQWFMVYEYLLEICVRFAPAVLLAVLNTWIIIEFKRISRRRRLLSQGMSCEVSAIPSQSFYEANNAPATSVVNASPTRGAKESSSPPPLSVGPSVPPLTAVAVPPSSVLSPPPSSSVPPAEGHKEANQGIASSASPSILNGRTSSASNGYAEGGGRISFTADTRNSSGKSFGRQNGKEDDKEKIGLSMINVSGPPPPAQTHHVARGMSERRHDMERRLVLLLVSIIVAFFVTNIPAAVLSLTFSDDKRNNLDFQIFRAIANNLEFLNFGLNFILYFLFSKDIRNAFTTLIKRAIDRVKEGIEGSSSKYAATNL